MGLDEEALVRVLVSERLKVLDFIGSIVRRPDLAEDVYQDVCMIAVEKRHTIQDASHLLKWLRTTARLRAMNVLRKRQERQTSLDDRVLDMLEADWSEHDTDDAATMAEAIRHCLAALAPKSRELVRRRYMEGLRYPEIAKLLDRPVTSIYTTFGRIHATLAHCMAGQLARGG